MRSAMSKIDTHDAYGRDLRSRDERLLGLGAQLAEAVRKFRGVPTDGYYDGASHLLAIAAMDSALAEYDAVDESPLIICAWCMHGDHFRCQATREFPCECRKCDVDEDR
jgi:hypothetical protein